MTKKTYKTKQAEQRRERKKIVLPILLLFMVAVWAWGSFYYGCLFHVSREFSFWATDTRLMQFVLCQNFGPLRYVGRLLLQLYQYPWLGGLCLSLMLGMISWLTGYCLRLPARWPCAVCACTLLPGCHHTSGAGYLL